LIASASGNVEESVHLLDQVLKFEPENVNALVAKATALRRAGRLDGAVECLDRAIALKPDHGGALLSRGRIFEDRGLLDAALDTYDRLVELGPTDTDAWVAQGNVLVKMGRPEDALRSYKGALKISPDDEDLRARVGGLDSARVQHDQLIRELLQIKGIGPARAKALQDTGFVTQDDFRKATEDDLLKVHGITRKVAADILAHFRGQVALDAK
ncbi:MAG: tetratricopeptide repeat protein, partial [Candidatus Thermoplasmatota archaeon]